MKIFKNKKFLMINLAVVAAGSVFAVFAVFAPSASAACGENNSANLSLPSISKPFLSFAEKIIKDFGYNVALATAPDPDFCGSDSVVCSGGTPQATISWTAAPHAVAVYGATYCDVSCFYIVTISGIGSSPQLDYTATSYTVSGLSSNTTYNWSVEAYYRTYQAYAQGYPCSGIYINSTASCGYTNQPYGSFTTPNCVYSLGVTKPGTGLGTVTSNPSGINCGGTCTATYTSGTSVTLTATPDAFSSFAGWSGNCSGATSNYTITVDGDKTCIATFNLNPPAAPSGLSATPGCDGTNDANVSLSWTDNASNETGFNVYRSTTSGFTPASANKITASPLPANSSSYLDATAAVSTTYYYKVRAVNVAGESSDSNQASATTSSCPAPNQPPNTALDIQNSGGTSISTATVGTSVYLYVGGSSDPDGSISTVRFCSDDTAGNGTCDSSWSAEYSWTTSSGSWNATTKKMSWSFSTAGNKGVYAQVKDNTGAWDSTPAEDTITISSLPDLITQNLAYSGILSAGSAINFSGNVKNNGGSSAAATNARFCIDNASCLTLTTGRVGTDRAVAVLAAGATSAVINPSTTWTATAGSHTVYFCADVGRVVSESDENNNCSSLPLTVAAANQAPVADAKISLSTCFSRTNSVTVTQGVPVNVWLCADDSTDPNGWTDATNGVQPSPGKCEWNSDLNQGSPSYETTVNTPASAAACNINLGSKTFNDAPSTYTYSVLRITDKPGAQSNVDTVQITVQASAAATFTVALDPSNIDVGDTTNAVATYDPDGPGPQASQNVTALSDWSSDNTSKATVDNGSQKGLVTGVAPGSAKITATYSGKSASATVTVNFTPTWKEIIPW